MQVKNTHTKLYHVNYFRFLLGRIKRRVYGRRIIPCLSWNLVLEYINYWKQHNQLLMWRISYFGLITPKYNHLSPCYCNLCFNKGGNNSYIYTPFDPLSHYASLSNFSPITEFQICPKVYISAWHLLVDMEYILNVVNLLCIFFCKLIILSSFYSIVSQ